MMRVIASNFSAALPFPLLVLLFLSSWKINTYNNTVSRS